MSDSADVTEVVAEPNLSNAKIIARGAGLSLFGRIAYRGLNYLFAVVIARGFGAGPYGLFSLGLATINVIKLLALLGLDQGSLRHVARFRAFGDVASEIRLARRLPLLVAGWGALIGVGVVLLAEPIAQLYGHDVPAIATLLLWLAPAVPLSALVLLLSAMSDGQRRIGSGVLSRDIVQPGVALILAWALLRSGVGVVGVVQGYVVSMALAVAVALYVLRAYFGRSHRPLQRSTRFSLQEVLFFSLPFLPMILLRQVGNRLEIFLLGFLSSPEEVGVFGAAASTALLVTFGLQAVWRIYAALAAELHARNELRQLEHLLKLTTRWSTTVGLPALIAICLFGEGLLSIFGDRFTVGSTALLVLALGQFVNAVTGPVDVTLNMAGYSRLILVNHVVALVLNIALDWWMIANWGILGAAIGSAVVMTTLNLITVLQVRVLLGIRPYDRMLLRPILASGLTLAVIWPALTPLGTLSPLPRILIGLPSLGMVYLLIFWTLLAPEEDRDAARSIWARVRTLAPTLGDQTVVQNATTRHQ